MIITDEMVDRALNAWFASPPSESDRGLEYSMRAALEAAPAPPQVESDQNEANDFYARGEHMLGVTR